MWGVYVCVRVCWGVGAYDGGWEEGWPSLEE